VTVRLRRVGVAWNDNVRIGGVRFDALTERDTVEVVRRRLGEREGGWVCAMNLDTLRQGTLDLELRQLVNSAEFVVADGMPLIWSSWLLRTPLPGRVAGSSLTLSLPRALAEDGRSMFLLGGNPGAAEGAAKQLARMNPGLTIAGTLCPPMGFETQREELERIVAALREAQPDVVFVGLGFPKQDRLIAWLRPQFPHSFFVSAGISFSFVTGEVRRAPPWLQGIGLEWLHRLVQEPRRLFRRYIIVDVPFALILLGASALRREVPLAD
jgi:N-acetylglucosaminyldiphosphoundecaprenol N-acetyl-beta-D-mannosaminyltransferase